MKKSSIILIFIFINAFFLCYIPTGNNDLQPMNTTFQFDEQSKIPEMSPSTKKWTFMVYMAADNNLEKDAINDINELEKVGSDYNINIVVQIDRIKDYDGTNGNWTGARRYYILKDYDHAKINSLFLNDLGETNTGKASTLDSFVQWSKDKYPAQNYALILWDHGGGVLGGMCSDNTNKDKLSLYEIKSVLVNNHVNLLGFDACSMGNVEVYYRYRDYVDAIVASEAYIPLDGFPYDTILDYLKKNPTDNALQVAQQIVLKYEKSYPTKRPLTLSAFKAFTPLFIESLTNFSDKLLDVAITEKSAITAARINAQKFENPDYLDLYDFAWEISPTIGEPASTLMSNMVTLQLAHRDHKPYEDSHGLSIYFPKNLTRYNAKYAKTAFGKDFNWDKFLLKYYTDLSIWEFNDFYENNNVPAEAFNIDQGTIYSLIINETDIDIFNVSVLIDNIISLDIYFNHSEGNLDLFLTNPQGTQVASSEMANDNESIMYVAPEDGIYSLTIDSITDDPYQVYDLIIDPGDDDPYDDNDNWGDGPLITASTLYPNLTCRDSDFFNISATEGELINITIDFDYFEGDLDLNLWSGQSPVLMASSNSDSGTENLLFAANYTGYYFIEVFNYSKNLNYSLYVEVSNVDDGNEENDIPDSATDLVGYGTTPDLVCMDDDYFNITLGSGIWVNITLIFNDTDGNIDVYLYNTTLDLVARSNSITDNEIIFYNVDSAGTYCIKVNCSDINLDYYLMVYETAAVTDDALEDNDEFSNACSLDIGDSYENLVAIDWDVFNIVGTVGYNLIITVDYNVSEGDIDIYLYDDSLELVGWSTEITNQEKIIYPVTITDTYFLLVHNYENNMQYNISISQEIIDDGEEEGETEPDAENPIISGFQVELLLVLIGVGVILVIRKRKFTRK